MPVPRALEGSPCSARESKACIESRSRVRRGQIRDVCLQHIASPVGCILQPIDKGFSVVILTTHNFYLVYNLESHSHIKSNFQTQSLRMFA